jgi:hypothetical protein
MERTSPCLCEPNATIFKEIERRLLTFFVLVVVCVVVPVRKMANCAHGAVRR